MKKTKSKIKIDKLSPSVEGSRNFKKISLLLNAKNFSQKTETPCILIVCNQFLDILSFDTLINESIRWDQGQWKVPPCKLARSIILTPFLRVDKRCPLYRIEDGFEGMDLNLLFEGNYLLDDFNDDQLGKLLDRIKEVGNTGLFSRIAFKALRYSLWVRCFFNLPALVFVMISTRNSGEPHLMSIRILKSLSVIHFMEIRHLISFMG